jgi:hypothetical protein
MDISIGDYAMPEMDAGIEVRLNQDSLKPRWGGCGQTADFLAAYMQNAKRLTDAESCQSIAFVLNELVENAVKFSAGGDIVVHVSASGGQVLCVVDNRIEPGTSEALKWKLRAIAEGDAASLLISRVEANAASSSSESGLGYLLMMSDYGASLGWNIRGVDGQQEWLSTAARISFEY